MTRLRLAFLIALFVSLQLPCDRVVFAQTPTRPAPTGLALEVVYYKGRPPGYLVVPGPGSEPRGAWHALFRRVSNWQTPEGSLPVRAVNVVSRMEGDSIRVIVSVYLGVRFHEKEALVATHLMRVNDRVEVRELTEFGVEPFEIKVVRVGPLLTNPPAVLSKAPSIAFTGAMPAGDTTLPSHRVSLQNLSAKDVVALGIEVHVGGRRQLSTIKQGKEGERLVAAGATYEFEVPGVNRAEVTPEGYAPAAPPNQEVVVTAAVFADGSYEGNARTAASFRAFVKGRRTQLARLIPVFQAALDSPGEGGATAAVEKFRAQVSALGADADPAVLEELSREFPAFDGKAKADVKSAVEIAMYHLKTDVLDDVRKFEQAPARPGAEAFRAWLSANKGRFESWLSKL